jgi:hypothetical protein
MGELEVGEDYRAQLARRRERIASLVAEAARAAGRDPGNVAVVAVSKTVDVEQVAAAFEAGYTAFGENRPQELERKLGLLAGGPLDGRAAWHMIGNLQENKINHVLACRPALVHSIASPKLAAAVSKRAAARGEVQRVLLEVNVSGEQSKAGMGPDELRRSLDDVLALPGIVPCGLMTMAPQGDAAVAERTFEGLRLLRDELRDERGARSLAELSMGMSEDFEAAIRQGATIVRLGRVVFDTSFSL